MQEILISPDKPVLTENMQFCNIDMTHIEHVIYMSGTPV